jgi:hypothetical protein
VIAKVRDLMRADQRLTTGKVAEEPGISFGPCQAILTKDLSTRCVSVKFIPWLLTAKQRHCMSEPSDLLECAADKNFFKDILPDDEACMYGYDSKTKQQTSQWKTSSSP